MDTTSNLSRCAERRHALRSRMGKGIAIIPTAPERVRNRDSDYLYRFDSYFYYLSAFPEPEAVLVLLAGEEPRSILFCRERNPDRELWERVRNGPEGAISAAAQERAMRGTRPGRNEYEIEAELLYEFRRRGAQYPAYWPIVAGGANACVLHYRDNNARLADGDLLLIDAGCELDGYASEDRKSTRLNSSHLVISYAVFCLKKKKDNMSIRA